MKFCLKYNLFIRSTEYMSGTIKPETKRHNYIFQAYYIKVTISQMKTTNNSVVRQYNVVYWNNSQKFNKHPQGSIFIAILRVKYHFKCY